MKKLLASLAAITVLAVPSSIAGGLYLGGGGSSFEEGHEEVTPTPAPGGGGGVHARRDYRSRRGSLYVTGYGHRGMWVLESDRSRLPDFIKIDGPKGLEILAVVCKNNTYRSYGYNASKTFARRVVEAWCRE